MLDSACPRTGVKARHPGPGEPVGAAVRRRAAHELGLTIDEPVCVLPEFRYRAVAADGIVENEICPVFCARTDGVVEAAAAEVMEWRWASWSELCVGATLSWPISPWAAAQIPLLDASGIGIFTRDGV
ncbi:MAG: NUDIX domain-containing protein [Rhodococcus sp. (in: high G+C Gram-positive bacteria)]|uniref:NUDIX domain-containing protein n=1 Tax=Rhodococcus sp. TaxID=1831 RepID=UPI003BAE7C45